jgi:hypothetical protein
MPEGDGTGIAARESVVALVAETITFFGQAALMAGEDPGEDDFLGIAEHVVGVLESAGYLKPTV